MKENKAAAEAAAAVGPGPSILTTDDIPAVQSGSPWLLTPRTLHRAPLQGSPTVPHPNARWTQSPSPWTHNRVEPPLAPEPRFVAVNPWAQSPGRRWGPSARPATHSSSTVPLGAIPLESTVQPWETEQSPIRRHGVRFQTDQNPPVHLYNKVHPWDTEPPSNIRPALASPNTVYLQGRVRPWETEPPPNHVNLHTLSPWVVPTEAHPTVAPVEIEHGESRPASSTTAGEPLHPTDSITDSRTSDQDVLLPEQNLPMQGQPLAAEADLDEADKRGHAAGHVPPGSQHDSSSSSSSSSSLGLPRVDHRTSFPEPPNGPATFLPPLHTPRITPLLSPLAPYVMSAFPTVSSDSTESPVSPDWAAPFSSPLEFGPQNFVPYDNVLETNTVTGTPNDLPLPVTSNAGAASKYLVLYAIAPTTLNFILDVVPRQVYLHILLRIPALYFSRVSRVFEDAQLSLPDIKRMACATTDDWDSHKPGQRSHFLTHHNPTVPLPRSLLNFRTSWEGFIDSLMREWKTLNIISVLLLSAILTMFYQEAQKNTANIWWNVWVLLAMPAIWLSWSITMFLTCIMSFIWLSGAAHSAESAQLSLGPRIGLTVVFSIALVYFVLIVTTFRQYGDALDRKWMQTVNEWANEGMHHQPSPFSDTGNPTVGVDFSSIHSQWPFPPPQSSPSPWHNPPHYTTLTHTSPWPLSPGRPIYTFRQWPPPAFVNMTSTSFMTSADSSTSSDSSHTSSETPGTAPSVDYLRAARTAVSRRRTSGDRAWRRKACFLPTSWDGSPFR
ncbi:hypothetical protein DFH06DRAFT_767146 [Mycena polygramma]|nr:hypothetical protein DFH06DRAFT_767146 [Mycena polygramma]